MSNQIRRVAGVVLLLFAALFVNLNVVTLLQADELANHPSNRRLIVREYQIERGPIVVAGEAVARSVPSEGELRYLRTYPDGPLYAHLTGYYSVVLQRSGLEAVMNEDLTGRPTEVVAQNLGDIVLGSDLPGNAVELTIDPVAQEVARDALAGREGAVVALDPRTGAVLVSYANPTFDPNPLSSHSPERIRDTWQALLDDPARPLVDRTRQESFPPGSAFKTIVAAAALERGLQPNTSFPDETVFDVPQTTANITNYSPGPCIGGGSITLEDALRVSCNTVFARLGVELGTEELVAQAERFGFNRTIPFELEVARSVIPHDLDVPATAQSAIGQRDVRATPMQMASVAAAIGNDGRLMRQHVVAPVRDPSGRRLRGADVGTWTQTGFDERAVSARTAHQLEEMLVTAVAEGTGSAARIEGATVGGKTGTAQDGETPTVWFVGFLEDRVAVAVVLPDAGEGSTGGGVAAPVARQVMTVLEERDP